MTARTLAYAAWTAVWGFAAAFAFTRACGHAIAGNHLQAAFLTLVTIGFIAWTRSARRRWREAEVAAAARRSLTEMRRTRYCSPPGHAWGPHPAGTPAEPGWCRCGEQYRNQDECEAVNNWRCEP